MPKLIFTRAQVLELATFCKENSLKTFSIAKDQDAYIVGTVGTKRDESFKNCIQYALGFEPDREEHSKTLCEGDDFGAQLDVSILFEIIERKSWSNLVFTLTPKRFSFTTS